jgi:hypothetical protein
LPDSLVVASVVVPRPTEVMVTFAPGTAAPVGSVTVPKMPPYTAWLSPAVGAKTTKAKHNTHVTAVSHRLVIAFPLCIWSLLPKTELVGTSCQQEDEK